MKFGEDPGKGDFWRFLDKLMQFQKIVNYDLSIFRIVVFGIFGAKTVAGTKIPNSMFHMQVITIYEKNSNFRWSWLERIFSDWARLLSASFCFYRLLTWPLEKVLRRSNILGISKNHCFFAAGVRILLLYKYGFHVAACFRRSLRPWFLSLVLGDALTSICAPPIFSRREHDSDKSILDLIFLVLWCVVFQNDSYGVAHTRFSCRQMCFQTHRHIKNFMLRLVVRNTDGVLA